MSIHVLQKMDDGRIKLVNFDAIEQTGVATFKTQVKDKLIIDSRKARTDDTMAYEATVTKEEDCCYIKDEYVNFLIKPYCTQKNTAFVCVSNEFYIQDSGIEISDNDPRF